ncbi:arf-GAP with SH3 domain, ANK repeat and PH domain-containing protein 2-like [Dysidea avara]|uniref:arf-GAP with SH3 domain, ANK repeat and PH domain-containing protein 2-like n=1 Tax=Dysidea avara TaxID=196820 RepID=UPI00331A54BE
MSNQLFNEVMEANLVDSKPNKETDAEERAQFIRNKYVQRKYIDRSQTVDSLELLYEAIDVRDFRALLQAYAEGVDMTQPLPNREDKYTALHLAVEQEDLTSLHIVEFMSTNSRAVNATDSEGNTALHIATQQGMLECMKILLRNGANVEAENEAQQTPLSFVEEEEQFADCLELLKDAQRKKLHVCDNVNIDWGVDEDDEVYQVPEVLRHSDVFGKIPRTRPISTYNQPSIVSATHLALKRTKSASPETTIGEEKEEDDKQEEKQKDEQQQMQQPTENKQSAPLPPSRSQSQDAIPINNKVSPLVPPKRKPKLSSDGTLRNSVALPSIDVPDGSSSPQIPPKPPQILYRVEALYDCTPDNKDELAFQEGDKLAITKEHGNDWLRGYVFGNPNQRGLIPFNYVKRLSNDSL